MNKDINKVNGISWEILEKVAESLKKEEPKIKIARDIGIILMNADVS